jgi:cytochrome c oxidase subunit 2
MARVADRKAALGAAMAALAAQAACAADSAVPLQDVLRPGGPQAAHVLSMWHLTLAVCSVVFVAVLVALGVALWRAPRAAAGAAPDLSSLSVAEPGAHRSVLGAVVASTLLLLFLIVASVLTDRALAQLSIRDAVTLQVTANQWWWEARYDETATSLAFTTANEIHVPVGRTVLVTLKSNDVIHSFWVPSLAGKKDLIPGRTARIEFRADKPGVYRGQCAEFCGVEHAWMAFEVVADPPDRYAAWVAHQLERAPQPGTSQQMRGQQLFVSTTCVMCHSISGTTASATHAPDLTHVASRHSIGAGTLPNTPADLKRWIRDPHVFKPGVNMPATNLVDSDLDAIVAYLETLT